MTEAAIGVDERKSLRNKSKLGQKLTLLEHLFDMVNRRQSVLSCRCLCDHRLGVLGVANINMSVCMHMLCV